jgi:hypothetical protein
MTRYQPKRMTLELLSKEKLQNLVRLLSSSSESNVKIIDKFLESERQTETLDRKKSQAFNIDRYSHFVPNCVSLLLRYRQRCVAIELQYEGEGYYGFASQSPGECDETIEKHMFDALLKLKLIESREASIRHNFLSMTSFVVWFSSLVVIHVVDALTKA